jgi:para-aminobenzoate synthetase
VRALAEGAAFGWFGYELGAPPDVRRLTPWPDAWFLLTDVVVEWERQGAPPRLCCSDEGLAGELLADLRDAAAGPDPDSGSPAKAASAPSRRALAPSPCGGTDSDFDFARYAECFAAARVALKEGESYQLCFTYPIERRLPPGGATELWRRLRRDHPAPFSAFVSAGELALVSCSPERFVRVGPGGRVEARPMKGTAPRPPDAAGREAAARALRDSEKVLAENLMIADLLRNDLGRVCRLGSVRASEPALVEEHATLLQMVSVIEGELDAGRSAADLLASAFPPGSMTGAPKVRSVELLRRLETTPRGPYSGILGWWSADGSCDWSVVIRTALCSGGRARLNVGGGLVWDSTAREEWDESRAKAAPLLAALATEGGGGAGGAPPGGGDAAERSSA